MLAIYAYLSIYSVECGVAVYFCAGAWSYLLLNKLIVSTLLFYLKLAFQEIFKAEK